MNQINGLKFQKRLIKLFTFTTALFIPLNVVLPSQANSRSDVVAALEQTTNVPVELPSMLPVYQDTTIYWNALGDADSYSVSFEHTPDCDGATFCTMGSFSAQRGGEIAPKPSNLIVNSPDTQFNDQYEYIKLNNGYSAVYINFCRAYCTASVQWKIQGVLYEASLKNGLKEDLLRMANSVYSN